MKQLVEFPLEEGGCIIVEVDVPAGAEGPGRVGREGEVIKTADRTFDAALDSIRPAATKIIDKLRKLADPPDEINVEFSLKVTATAGAVIASGGIEGNYKVAMKWARPKPEPK